MIKIVFAFALMTNLTLTISLKSVKQNVSKSGDRKLLLEEANMPNGNVYTEQLENTTTSMNEMTNHGRRTNEMKQVGQWFLDIDERMDDFRDAVSRKLNELHMALSKPHMANMMAPPPPQMMNSMMMMGGSRRGGSQMVDAEEEQELEDKDGDDEERRRRRFMHI